MAGNFVAGHLVPVGWQSTGGALVVLNVKDHSIDLSVLLHDVTGYKANGVRARIAGPLDASGRVVCDLDLDEPWYGVPHLFPGTRGIVAFGVNALGNSLQLPMICEKIHQSGATDKELMWDCDWKMSSLAGLVVYPAM